MTHPAVLPPSDKPTRSQLAGCYGKAAYPSKGAALETVRHIRKRGKAGKSEPFRCPHCSQWHLRTPRSGL